MSGELCSDDKTGQTLSGTRDTIVAQKYTSEAAGHGNVKAFDFRSCFGWVLIPACAILYSP